MRVIAFLYARARCGAARTGFIDMRDLGGGGAFLSRSRTFLPCSGTLLAFGPVATGLFVARLLGPARAGFMMLAFTGLRRIR